jgi:hydroxymethylpyrimidine pyrophosphatase-like HAD family hydrolase
LRFNKTWQRDYAPASLLVWSTGRSPSLFRELWLETPLLTPDVLICSVGTEVFYRDCVTGEFFEDREWALKLDAGGKWKRSEAERAAASVAALRLQRASEQRPHKLSFHSPAGAEGLKAVAELRAALDAAGMTEDVAKIVYSGGTDVDVLAAGAGKGRALEAVLGEARGAVESGAAARAAAALGPPGAAPPSPSLPFLPAGLQVNGDSGNDAELFEVEDARGCVVANAHEELRGWYKGWSERQQAAGEGGGDASNDDDASNLPRVLLASEPCSGGILEVLEKFGTAQAIARLEEQEEAGGADAARAAEVRAARRLVVEGGFAASSLGASSPGLCVSVFDEDPVSGPSGRQQAVVGRQVPWDEWARAQRQQREQQGQQLQHQWVDGLRVRPNDDGTIQVEFEAWSGGIAAADGGGGGGGGGDGGDGASVWRRRPTAREITAVLRPREGGGFEVCRMVDSKLEKTATDELAALVDGGRGVGVGGGAADGR